MIINISYINAANGMFWYAIDKIKTLGDVPVTVFVNSRLAHLVRQELPHANVHEKSKTEATLLIMRKKLLNRSQERIVAFTSHPLPFVGNQTIAFHDDYPFMGRKGWVKRMLFVLAARTSECRVGIVNRSLAIPFLTACGISTDRIFFDSAFPSVDVRKAKPRLSAPGRPMTIGLVGADSRKKNYDQLFSATLALGQERDVRFRLYGAELQYGAENDYVQELRAHFPTIDLTVLSSDKVGLVEFFDGVDYLVSAARAEGYGRPMGLAAALGVPLFLLRSPVFLEFFGEYATFFDDALTLMRHIVDTRPPAAASGPRLAQAVPERSPFFA